MLEIFLKQKTARRLKLQIVIVLNECGWFNVSNLPSSFGKAKFYVYRRPTVFRKMGIGSF